MDHCHRDPVNTFFINMLNSLFRLLILLGLVQWSSTKYNLFTKLVNLANPWNFQRSLEILGAPHATKPKYATAWQCLLINRDETNDRQTEELRYMFMHCLHNNLSWKHVKLSVLDFLKVFTLSIILDPVLFYIPNNPVPGTLRYQYCSTLQE